MKAQAVAVLLAALLAAPSAAAGTNPVQKTLELLSQLQARILKEGSASTKVYDEFAEWCEDSARDAKHSISTMEAEHEDLQASIEQATDSMESLGTKIEELSSAISTDEADLKAATLIRDKEASDFTNTQKDLLDTIDIIERSINILERAAKGGTSFAQLEGVGSLAQTLSSLVEASALSAADATRLTSLIQNSASASSESEDGLSDESAELGAPAAQTYENHGGVVIETMQSLLDKAEAQLDDSRQSEATKSKNFAVLKQSLEDKLHVAQREMAAAKKGLAESGQRKATAEGNLAVTEKDLKEATQELAELHHNCMSKASDFQEEMTSRGEELAALAKAKQIISDMTGGAEQQTYSMSQVSFLQVEAGQEAEGGESADLQAVRLVKRLARERRSPALMQLSFRLDSALRTAAVSGADPFAKVKGLINDMLDSLMSEQSAEARHKSWCDQEMSRTTEQKQEKEVTIEKLTTRLDQTTAGLTSLAEEVAVLQKELAELANSQAEMSRIRQEEHSLFLQQKPEMEEGIRGVQLALQTLREYYAMANGAAHTVQEGGGSGIIGLLQVVESDFAKGLSELVATEDASAKVFADEAKENQITRETKETDVSYKSKMLKADEKTSTELAADRDGVRTELDAVGEYLAKLQDQCVAKAEPYEERKKRREQNISGLREALQLLTGEPAPALLQAGQATSHALRLRGVRPHSGA